ncbi:MAG: histidine kinase N-terminal 7TM domain-containing protein [Candidatus Caccovivens sp.]
MKKLFCKKNLIFGSVFLCVVTILVLCLVFGKKCDFSGSRKTDILIYSLVAIFSSLVMFNCITKILDKKIKYLFFVLFCLFLFWLSLKIFDKVATFDDNNDFIWYLLYLPLLFVPNLWFLINNQIYLRNKKLQKILAIVSLSISSLLFFLVLTNDLHQLVFIFPDGLDGAHYSDYKYNFGYFFIYAFIFIEILTTVVLFYVFSVKKSNIKQKVLPSIIILLILIYSVLYISVKIKIPYLNDMTLMYVILGTLLAYVSFKSGLIKNSGNYLEFFENCVNPLVITNKDEEIVYQNTKFGQLKEEKNYILEKQSITNGTLLTLEDVGTLKSLQEELKNEIKNLTYSNKILEKKKEILQNEKRMEQHTKLLKKVEQHISNKKIELENLLPYLTNNKPGDKNEIKEILNQIKLVVGYLKRKTSLFLQAEQKDTIAKSELNLIFRESFEDLKFFDVNAGIGIGEEEISANIAIKFYDVYNELMTILLNKNFDVWITLNKRKTWEFKFIFENIKIDEVDLKLPKEYGLKCSFIYDDDSTIVCFEGGEL